MPTLDDWIARKLQRWWWWQWRRLWRPTISDADDDYDDVDFNDEDDFWNQLAETVKNAATVNTFKRRLKTYLFKLSYFS